MRYEPDWQERPHATLSAAAIATAPMTLPRGSSQIHQFWVVNTALPSATQLPMRALEALALPALAELARSTQEPLWATLPPAEMLDRYTGWFRAQVVAADGGVSPAELAQVTCPIGVPGIHGKQPEVIAVAVAAQLLQTLTP